MTNLKQITNPNELVLSFNSGQGKLVGTHAEIVTISEDNLLTYGGESVQVDDCAIKANYVYNLTKSIGKTLNVARFRKLAMQHAEHQLSDNHKPEGETSAKTSTIPPGHVMTAASFEKACYERELDLWEVVQKLMAVKDSLTKAEIISIVQDAIAIPDDVSASITEYYAKDMAIMECERVMREYLKGITRIDDYTVVGFVRDDLTEEQSKFLTNLTNPQTGTYPHKGFNIIPAIYEMIGFTNILKEPQQTRLTVSVRQDSK